MPNSTTIPGLVPPAAIDDDELRRLTSLLTSGTVETYSTRGEWLASRQATLGASQLADLFGFGYRSEYETWAKFAHPEEFDDDEATEADPWDNERMEWGRRMEGAILGGVADREGWVVHPWPQTWRVRHDALRLSCTPDAVAVDEHGDTLLVEVKHLNEFAARDWPIGDDGQLELTPRFELQAQAQMACTGIRRVALAMLFGGQRLIVVRCHWHEAFQQRLAAVVGEFWERVRDDVPPPVDGSESSKRAIFAMHPRDQGHAVDLDAEFDEMAEALAAAKVTKKDAESQLEELKNRIKAAIGDATYGVTPGGHIFSNKLRKYEGFDRNKLAAEHPEIYEDVKKVSYTRVLLAVKKIPGGVEFLR